MHFKDFDLEFLPKQKNAQVIVLVFVIEAFKCLIFPTETKIHRV